MTKLWDGMNIDPSAIKYGKNREMVMWSSGDVFCSLSDEELEVERKAAEENDGRFYNLMLIEKSSRMNLDDFINEYKRWEVEKEDHETWLFQLRGRMDWNVSLDKYKYERESYDTNKATDAKLKRYKKLNMIGDHVKIILTLGLGIYFYSTNFVMSILLFGFSVWNIVDTAVKWYHMYTERDAPEYVNG